MSSNDDNDYRNHTDACCFVVFGVVFYIFFMLSWLIVYDTGSEQTKTFLMWEALTDDPLIAWLYDIR
jgi:hypothetical protein